MIDLHFHLLSGIDDGAKDLDESLEMARIAVAGGVKVVACTPHFLPGIYDNSGPDIRARVDRLQDQLEGAGIECRLVSGGDVHIAPDLVAKLKSGEILSLNNSRYVLVEPPHHVLPPNIEALFFNLLVEGYVPVITHPERMSWIDRNYDVLVRLVRSGAWTQMTAGALLGHFGSRAKSWTLRLLCDGLVHIVASDAHGAVQRPPLLGEAYRALIPVVGHEEALNLVQVRPEAILRNQAPSAAPKLSSFPTNGYEGAAEPLWNRVSRYFGAV